MKFKKLLLGIGLSSTVVVFPISAVACNNSDASSESISKEMKTVFDEMITKITANPQNAMQIAQEMSDKLTSISKKAAKLSKKEQEKFAKKIQEYVNELMQRALNPHIK
ncbi:hypothetical protein [Mycoplasma sp. 4F]|uniref:hypothetical protein n=1 Tax=Mycoplasma sp. 4F TaxID=3401664 RepID=UPI003AACB33E